MANLKDAILNNTLYGAPLPVDWVTESCKVRCGSVITVTMRLLNGTAVLDPVQTVYSCMGDAGAAASNRFAAQSLCCPYLPPP